MEKLAHIKELVISEERVLSKIYLIRNQKIMLDRDLAELYGVETKRLKETVRRHADRFPEDFMFQLTASEQESLRTQFASLEKGRGQHSKYQPFAFTEQGVALLSSVLNSDTAIQVNIEIIRIFTRMRAMIITHKDILLRLEKLERGLTGYDQDIQLIFKYLKQLLTPPDSRQRQRIGFRRKHE